MVHSYFGMREVALDGLKFTLNGKAVFQRVVLDQGFYPDGIITAPTDEALKNDIIYSQSFGFNGARLHQKIFEPRFLYWADKLGYPVWGEYPSWGTDFRNDEDLAIVLPEWSEALERDVAHPSIIGWCPLNETGIDRSDFVLESLYRYTKAFDPTRPCIDTSGYFHCKYTDIYDVHDYTQDPKVFAEHHKDGDFCNDARRVRTAAPDEPYFVSEYGGMSWFTGVNNGWGYGGTETEEDFFNRYAELTLALLKNPKVMGFCYTQLYDIEQEQNGFLTYDRKYKFDPENVKKVNDTPAAIEEQ